MGIRLIIILSFVSAYSSIKEKNIQIVKEVALCRCILNNLNQLDSLKIDKDVSISSYFNENSFLTLEKAKMIDSFVKIQTKDFYILKSSHTVSSIDNSNEILKNCIGFTKTITFKNFSKKVLKK